VSNAPVSAKTRNLVLAATGAIVVGILGYAVATNATAADQTETINYGTATSAPRAQAREQVKAAFADLDTVDQVLLCQADPTKAWQTWDQTTLYISETDFAVALATACGQ
jgi:hypothetical protein